MGNHQSKGDQLSYDAKDWTESDKSTFYEVVKNKKGQ
jgi:hypothetical protein